MSNVSEFTKCANCGACYNICPTNAIRTDGDGLYYRVTVDEMLCVGCGKCVAVCPVNRPESRQALRSAAYAAHRDDNIVKASSSGGAFSALAQWVLEQGGVVFGAGYSENCRQVVFYSTDEVSLDELRRSKYVESQVCGSFRKVKAQLERGRKVLFCGTPCQVAGLVRYLGREYDDLYTCDFSCGGLPSHEIYQRYLCDLESKYGAAVAQVNFRPKTLGWEDYAVQVTFDNGKVYNSPAVLDPYFSAFVEKHYSIREYCLNCDFGVNHYADIILADFWKYRVLSEERRGSRGLSLMVANSEKGQRLLERAAGLMTISPLNLEDAAYNMKREPRTDTFLKGRKAFLDTFREDGLVAAARCLDLPDGARRLMVKIKSFIKHVLWGVR